MTTVYEWSSTADTGWSGTAGTAPSNETAGTYGQRWKWAASTSVCYGYRSGFSLTDFGVRFIYQLDSFASSSHMIWQGLVSGPSAYCRVDWSTSGKLRIRNSANTQLSEGTYTHVTDTEYRFEIYRVGSTLTVKTYDLAGTLLDTITGSVGSSTIERMYWGNNATLTGTLGIFTVDEIVVTDVGAVIGAPSSGVADAGDDVSNIVPGTNTDLDGSGSTGSTWLWELIDWTEGFDEDLVTITSPTSQNTDYDAPYSLFPVDLTFRLTVNGAVTDTVVHSVQSWKTWWLDSAVWKPLFETPSTVEPGDPTGDLPPAPSGWSNLLWADNFDGDDIDPEKWWSRNGKGQSPGNQQALYLSSKIHVHDSMLSIHVDREDVTNGGTLFKWTAGEIQSDGLMTLPNDEEWRLEFRMRNNMVDGHSRGLWPAVWARNAPSVGEIDFMEAWGTPADHSGLYDVAQVTLWQNTSGTQAKIGKVVASDWSEWEDWACEGNPVTGTYKFFRNGVKIQEKGVADAAWLKGTEYSSPFYIRICVQVAKAGSYWGAADDSLVVTNGHYEFDIDWIRAYAR